MEFDNDNSETSSLKSSDDFRTDVTNSSEFDDNLDADLNLNLTNTTNDKNHSNNNNLEIKESKENLFEVSEPNNELLDEVELQTSDLSLKSYVSSSSNSSYVNTNVDTNTKSEIETSNANSNIVQSSSELATSSKQIINLPPIAYMLFSSLRSMGYKPHLAIADIIDNSISANAKDIYVEFIWDELNSSILIYDNGQGMSYEKLVSAMRIGSSDSQAIRNADDLGRYGMGMKSASISMGYKMTVYSKQQSHICSACWDLSYIVKNREENWNVVATNNIESCKVLDDFESGTLIKIEALDKLIDFDAIAKSNKDYSKNVEKSKRAFYAIIEKVSKHLSLTFHRYIAEEGLKIYVQNEELEPWDPFLLNNSATQELSEEIVREDPRLGIQSCVIQPYVIPHPTKYKSKKDQDDAEGFKDAMNHQGIYIYRNKRLILWGKWFGFVEQDISFSLARIRVDITSDADKDWKIDVLKSKAEPPLYVRNALDIAITECTEASAKVYNARGTYSKKGDANLLGSIWIQKKNRIGKSQFYLNQNHPLYKEIFKGLTKKQKENLKTYLTLVEKIEPQNASRILSNQDSKKELNIDKETSDLSIYEIKQLIKELLLLKYDKKEIQETLFFMPEYEPFQEQIKAILEGDLYDEY